MKKRFAMLMLLTAMTASMITGCGTKNSGDSGQNSQTAQENSGSEETASFTGTLDEKKDFMFIVTDDAGNSYEFTFDKEKPEGLDKVKVGDMVTVTYTGTVSEVDPFMGEVLSVTEAK